MSREYSTDIVERFIRIDVLSSFHGLLLQYVLSLLNVAIYSDYLGAIRMALQKQMPQKTTSSLKNECVRAFQKKARRESKMNRLSCVCNQPVS